MVNGEYFRFIFSYFSSVSLIDLNHGGTKMIVVSFYY